MLQIKNLLMLSAGFLLANDEVILVDLERL